MGVLGSVHKYHGGGLENLVGGQKSFEAPKRGGQKSFKLPKRGVWKVSNSKEEGVKKVWTFIDFQNFFRGYAPDPCWK